VFLSAQLNLDFTYDCTVASEWDIIVKIQRYAGFPTTTAGDNDYLFDLDTNGNPVVSQQVTHYSQSTSGSSGNNEYIFTTVLDQPSFGYYWYILDIVFSTKNPLLGGLLEQPYGSQTSYTYSGTSATQVATTSYTNVIPKANTTINAINAYAVV
jgi:hypothetical protein